MVGVKGEVFCTKTGEISIRAQTINGDEITKISKYEIHKVNLYGDYWELRIAFPKVEIGSILEVSYTFISKKFHVFGCLEISI